MSYLNSVTIVGFVGANQEQRQARNNGSKFTVLSVAAQRSWKNAEDEWVWKVEWHRVAIIWNLKPVQSYLGLAFRCGEVRLRPASRHPLRKDLHYGAKMLLLFDVLLLIMAESYRNQLDSPVSAVISMGRHNSKLEVYLQQSKAKIVRKR